MLSNLKLANAFVKVLDTELAGRSVMVGKLKGEAVRTKVRFRAHILEVERALLVEIEWLIRTKGEHLKTDCELRLLLDIEKDAHTATSLQLLEKSAACT